MMSITESMPTEQVECKPNDILTGPALAAARAALGLSKAKFAALVGLSHTAIYDYESGKSRPNEEARQKLLRVLNSASPQPLPLPVPTRTPLTRAQAFDYADRISDLRTAYQYAVHNPELIAFAVPMLRDAADRLPAARPGASAVGLAREYDHAVDTLESRVRVLADRLEGQHAKLKNFLAVKEGIARVVSTFKAWWAEEQGR